MSGRLGLATAAVLAAGAIVAPSGAGAARPLATGFADNLYHGSDEAARDFAFDRTVDANADIVRVNVVWRTLVQGQPANPRDPADPAYGFGAIDAAVREAAERGLDVVLTLYSAPTYAEGPGRPAGTPAGTWRPDPAAFADFAAAVASRYSGGFAGLPRVRYFQAWNEPNLTTYLNPQYAGRAAQSPDHYVAMLNAFFEAVKAVDGDNVVVTAGTAPYGDPPGGQRVRPLRFWRDVLCLRGRKKLRGGPCPVKARFDALAHHPINTSGGPRRSAIDPNDASTPDFRNVRRTLRAAERRNKTGTRGRHQLWATEIWWESDPPDGFEGVPLRRHARWLEQALYLLWKQGARVVINLQVRDGHFDPGSPFIDDSAGLLFESGEPKPAFRAFRFPFVADRTRRGPLRLWGKAPAEGRLKIQRKRGGKWRTVKRLNAREGKVFKARVRLKGKKHRLRAEVAGERSLPWVQR